MWGAVLGMLRALLLRAGLPKTPVWSLGIIFAPGAEVRKLSWNIGVLMATVLIPVVAQGWPWS